MTRRIWLLSAGLLGAKSREDRGLGKWRFVAEASTYESGPAPRESQRQWVKDGDGVRFLHDGVSAEGKAFHTEFTAKYDGKPYPFVGGTLYNTVALHWKSADRVDQVFRKDKVITVKATRTVSPDGKRLTIDARGTGAAGKRFKNLLVYERD